MVLTRRLIKPKTKEDYVMLCHIEAGNITNNMEVKIYFTFPEFRANIIVTWECNVDESAKGTYDMLLGRYILT